MTVLLPRKRARNAVCFFCGRARPAVELIRGRLAHYCPIGDPYCVDRRNQRSAA